jgi:ATP-binding cassette, subfamily B, bacterial
MQTYNLPRTLPAFLLHFIKQNWISFLFIQLFCFGMTIENTFWPKVISMVIAAIESYQGPKLEIWSAISSVVFLGAALWILIDIFFRMSGILLAKVMPEFEAKIRMSLFGYVNKQSYSFFTDNFSGSLANKINDLPRSSHSIMMMLCTLFIPVFATAIIITGLFTYLHPYFGLVIFSWMATHLGICIFTARKCQDFSQVHAESRSRLAGRIVDSFSNNVSVRIFSRHQHEFELIQKYQNDEANKQKQALWYMEKVKIALGIVSFLFIGIFLTWLQIHFYKNGLISIADLVFTMQGTMQVSMSVWWAGLELPRFFQEVGVCKQALSLVNIPVEVMDKPNAQSIQITKGEIIFQQVGFKYEQNNHIFKNQSVVIKPGQKVGLVGFSGSGKTTFVNLILRHYDVHEGKILIDQQDISSVKQASLREQIAMIPQEPALFHRSLMENIRYGRLDATDEEVIEASKKAFCHDFVLKMQNGYNTTVGDRGLKLSGGQRQRIAIARAILKNAPILIMDEATSALDSVTENCIQESLHEITKARTTLIIAHRLSTLSDMDRILVFKYGSIVEDGTHEQLLEKSEHYSHLWNMQVDGFIPDKEDEEEE